MTLSKIQGLVYRNESALSSRLTAQKPLREAFDDALTGCRMTLAALNLELEKLVEPKIGTRTTEFGFQAKARLVWKEAIMKQLLDQSRGQMTSLHYFIQFLESETQADTLKSLQKNLADIRRIFHRAKSIRLDQGIEEDQSSFHFTHQAAAFGLVPSYEAQLSQSSTYQRAQTAAAEELLAKKIELMDEKYALEDKVEGLRLEIDLKDETIRQLHQEISIKDQRIGILEGDPFNGSPPRLNEESITELKEAIWRDGEVVDLKKGGTIHQAARKGYANAMGLLLRQGASLEAIDEEGKTPLMVAASNGRVRLLQMLLEQGAYIDAGDYMNNTSLHLAVIFRFVEVVKILLEKGADTKRHNVNGRTPLHMAASEGHAELVQMLLEAGADIESLDSSGRSPLIWSVHSKQVEIVKILLEKRADVKHLDVMGRAPLILAVDMDYPEIVQMLLKNEANRKAVRPSRDTRRYAIGPFEEDWSQEFG